jgi:Zn-dependent protease with chaperone function
VPYTPPVAPGRQMRKRVLITIALVILAAPLFGMLVSGIVDVRLLTMPVAERTPTAECATYGNDLFGGADSYCDLLTADALLWKASLALLALTLLVPSAYAALAYTIGRRANWLASYFPWVVRPTMLALALLLVLQGLVVMYAALPLSAVLSFMPIVPLIWCVLCGLGFVGVALLILAEAFSTWKGQPFPIVGMELGAQQLPELTALVARLAEQLHARPPARIIIGLEPRAFVASMPFALRGIGTLPSAETLYLSTCFLRVLDEQQLKALIGHELAHFREGDLAFTLRFAPSFRGLARTVESVAFEVKPTERPGLWSLARLPASFLVQGIALVLAHAVNRIRRARELQADQIAAAVASRDAFASALVKVSLLASSWKIFRSENAKYLASGRARVNLSARYQRVVAAGLSKMDRGQLRQGLLKSRLAHPIDTHPVLAERLQALGVEPAAVCDRSLEELMLRAEPPQGLEALERALTATENEWMCIPGTPYVLDTGEELPSQAPSAVSAS